jgi:hypothetical protein
MIDKITIPIPDAKGYCSSFCPFYVYIGVANSECSVDKEDIATPSDEARPGPECIPGEYALIPVDDLAALRA